MKKLTRLLTMFCVTTLLVTMFVGCGQTKKEGPQTKQAQTTSGSDFSKKIKFSYVVQYGELKGKDEIYKAIADKFNVDVEFISVLVDNSWTEKVRIWMASGDMPDAMLYDFKAATFGDYVKYAKQGLLKPLPADLDKKYPNMAKAYSMMSPQLQDKIKVDGKSYIHLMASGDNDKGWGFSQTGFVYRKDWAEKLGITKTEFTWDEMKDLAKQFMQKDPNNNGAGKTIGMVGAAWSFMDHYGVFPVNPYYDRFQKVDGKYVWMSEAPETYTGLKETKALYDEGILYKDFFSLKGDDHKNMYYAGRTGILFDTINVSGMNTIRSGFAKANPGIDPSKAVAYMKVLGPGGKPWDSDFLGFWAGVMYNAKMDDEKFNRILAMTDWMASDEGINTSLLGIKGKDWDIENGKTVCKWPKDEAGNFKRPTDRLGEQNAFFNMGVLATTFYAYNPTYSTQLVNDYRDWMDWRKQKGINVRITDIDEQYTSLPYKDKEYGPLRTALREKAKELVVSSKDIEKDWKAYLDTQRDKANSIMKELNDALGKK